MELAAADSARAAPIEKRSLLGLELEIDEDEEEDGEKDRHSHRRRFQTHPTGYGDDNDGLDKKRRPWLTYTGRRNLIVLLPVLIGGLVLTVVVLKAGKQASPWEPSMTTLVVRRQIHRVA